MGNPTPPNQRATATLRGMLLHRYADQISEGLIYFTVVFSPWAFGTTQRWAIWTMDVTGYLLGLCLLAKYYVRLTSDYRVDRWSSDPDASPASGLKALLPKCIVGTLAVLSVAIPLYCLVAALNARAVYIRESVSFDYRQYIGWLPHSYDRVASFHCFENYLAMAGFFWAVRDWLLGRTKAEVRAARHGEVASKTTYLPRRLRRLLLVLAINGALLGIEGILQRESGTQKMLWIHEPRDNRENESQFGPYNYRGNAAQYFNMAWPMTLALWWALWRETRHSSRRLTAFEKSRCHLLLLCALIMSACPILSMSRLGVAVTVLAMGSSACVLLVAMRRRHPAIKFALVLFFLLALAFGFGMGEESLHLTAIDASRGLALRESMYETARKIPADFPWLGTGPGSFEAVFSLYRSSNEEYWPAQLHNDWLETRITFGWIGSALIALALFCVLARWSFSGPLHGSWAFASLLQIALAGCLLNALFDFPMQVYSTLLLFVLICAVLFTVSRRSSG